MVNRQQIGRSLALSFAAFVFIASIMAVIGFNMRTLADWRIVIAICTVIAALLALSLCNVTARLTRRTEFSINYPVTIVALTPIIAALFYVANYTMSRRDEAHTERCVITRKYQEEHKRTRRVGRRYIATDETYPVYYVTVSLPGGVTKDLSVNFSRYRHIHKGDTVSMTVEPGLFGPRVIKGNMLP